MKRKKILFVISQLYKGGAETSLVNLIKLLDKSKYEISLLILDQVLVERSISLIPHLPSNIKICNAFEEEKNLSVFNKFKSKFLYSRIQ